MTPQHHRRSAPRSKGASTRHACRHVEPLRRRTLEGVFMKYFPRSILGAAIASVLAVPSISWAQSADATLRGSAPAESEVTARNVATGLTRRTKANADGVYFIAGLPPGTYKVDAGPGTETTVTLSVA